MKMTRVVRLMMAGLFFYVSAQAADNFSADVYSKMNQQSIKGKIYVSSQKTRTELGGVVIIARMDKKVAWTLMPGSSSYMETEVNPEQMIVGSEKLPGEIERKALAKETVDGKMCDKYRIVSNQNGKQQVIYSWVALDSGIPLKTSADDGSWEMVFRNVAFGSQPESLFELPAGYQKMSMGASGMPAGMDSSSFSSGMDAGSLPEGIDPSLLSNLGNLTKQMGDKLGQ